MAAKDTSQILTNDLRPHEPNTFPLEGEAPAGSWDWDSADDPANPRNWPLWQRILHTGIPALWSFGLCAGISTLVAALPQLQQRFEVERNVALLPVSLYTIGFSIGPCIASPVSEIYGRRWVYWTNFPMLFIFTAIAAASNNFAMLVTFRFLAGLGGSGVLAVAAGSLSDIWEPKDAGRVGVPYILAPFLGPTLGPLIGAYILQQYDNDWRWSLWVLLCIIGPAGIAIPFMRETSKSRILYMRHGSRGRGLKDTTTSYRIKTIRNGLLRPFHMTLVEPLTLFLGLYTSYSFAMIFSFFGSYAYIYSTVYGFDAKQIGLCYIPVIVGFLLAVVVFAYFDVTKYQKELQRSNHVAPEHRLYAALFGSWMVTVGLFWFAWAPRESVHWIAPVLAGLPMGCGTLTGFLSSIAYIVDVYGSSNSASAVVANGFLRFLLGAAFPQFIIQLYQSQMGIQWAGSIFAFLSLLLVPVPWLLFYKGPRLRSRSLYLTSAN
ncbi:major facilitator superfamily domain-containing protein [Stachybotrys elegans]|uniref:Major facilitator superfamily domain-containing protein n=1 Tax=Stachybotrys elegans TaxID=80388 RepID=A0A8K0SNA4_9HYPO|nr:major facilitator superfamily domain-containing protein [Stachybotrys elegans]